MILQGSLGHSQYVSAVMGLGVIGALGIVGRLVCDVCISVEDIGLCSLDSLVVIESVMLSAR
jgi:hypothetical protein